MARRLVYGFAVIGCGAGLWLIQSNKDLTHTNRYNRSYQALVDWNESRAYPFPNIPPSGLTEASEELGSRRLAKQTTLNGNWRPLGPNAGSRTLALAVDPTDPNRVFAGTASGGLWISDGMVRANWRRITTGFPVSGVASIAIDPDNSARIFIGTGEVYGTLNALGGTSSRSSRGSYGIGILMSEDGGNSWSMSLDWRQKQTTGIQDIAFDPQNSMTIWAATTEGVYVSTDSGITWQQRLAVLMATSVTVHPNNSNSLVAACGGLGSPGGGIYHSQDKGLSWTMVNEPVPSQFLGKIKLDRAPSQPDRIYATIGDGTDVLIDGTNESWLLRSDTNGTTWSVVNRDNFADYQGWYSHYPAVDPIDANRVFVGGIDMYLSTTGGSNLLTSASFGADQHTLAFAPSDPDILYLSSDFGVARSENRGTTTRSWNDGFQTIQFYNGTALDSDGTYYGSAQDTGMWVVTPNGSDQAPAGSEGGMFAIDSDQLGRIYASTAFHFSFYRNWQKTTPVPYCPDRECNLFESQETTNFLAPFAMSPVQTDVIYAGRDLIYRSNDGGDNWTLVNEGQSLDGNPVALLVASYQNADRLYAVTSPRHNRMQAFRSDDSGQSWVSISEGLPDRFPGDLIIDRYDDTHLLLLCNGFGDDRLFETHNSGTDWSILARHELPNLPTTALAIDPTDQSVMYLGNDLTAYASLDSGCTWFAIANGLPEAVQVSDIAVHPAVDRVLLASHGNGAFDMPRLQPAESPSMSTSEYTYSLPDIQVRGSDQTQIIIINPSDSETATVQIIGMMSGGKVLTPELQLTLLPKQREQVDVHNWLDQPEATRWAQVRSNRPLVMVVDVVQGDQRFGYVGQQATEQAYLPHVAKDTVQFQTDLILANPGTTNMQLDLVTEQLQVDLGRTAKAFFQEHDDIRYWLGNDLSFIDWATIQSDQGIAAVETFERRLGKPEKAGLALTANGSQELSFLHIAEDTELFWTGIVYINVNDDPVSVEEQFFDSSGNQIAQRTVELAGAMKRTLLVDAVTQSAPDPEVPLTTAWVHVSATGPLVGYELFGSPLASAHQVFSGLQASSSTHQTWHYALTPNNTDEWVGLVAVNLGNQAASLALTHYSNEGHKLAEHMEPDVAAKAKRVSLMSDWFPDTYSQGGWVEAQAMGSWSGFQLLGNYGSTRRHLVGVHAPSLD